MIKKGEVLPRPSRPVLIIQHTPHEHPAAVRRALMVLGIPMLWIRAYEGEPYPESSEIGGILSLGGPMSANDEHRYPWIRTEIRLLQRAVEAELPVVGVCLGGQLLARALGAEVARNSAPELGWFPVKPTALGQKDRILGSMNAAGNLTYHWHYETFSLPIGADLLASSEGCSQQAFRAGPVAYGFQFHPEADRQLIREWLAHQDVHKELAFALSKPENHHVQTVEEQENHSILGELDNLRLSAAIAELFEKTQPKLTIQANQLQGFQEMTDLKIPVVLEFKGAGQTHQQLAGSVVSRFKLPDGDLVILRETRTSLLWPIRTDRITGLKPVH